MRQASTSDGPALADLLLRNPQAGRLVFSQDRGDDVFARRSAFQEAATFVVEDAGGGLEAAVTVASKDVVVGARPMVAGYVFDLVVDGPARGRGLARRLLSTAEVWARQQGARLLYATIVGGNRRSHAVFRAAGYGHTLPMGMRLFPVFRDRDDRPAGPAQWDAGRRRLREWAAAHDLAPQSLLVDPAEAWAALPGWRPDDAWVTDRAVLALWDHRAVSRPIPLGLPPGARLLSTVGRAARTMRVPFPSAPQIGVPVATGYLLGGAGTPADLRQALRAALARARTRGLDVVTFAHAAGRRPAWTRAAFSVGERYDILAKGLDGGSSRLGARPVWADPADL